LIVITGGSTGGHIFPNISVIEELKKRGYTEIIWVGEKKGKEEKWARSMGVAFYGIRTGKLRRYLSLKNLIDLYFVVAGIFQSIFLFIKLKPSLLFSKGGFVAVPPVIAAGVLSIPIITHESDIIPGLATRIISRFARVICVSFEITEHCFTKKKVVLTGNPLRETVKYGNSKKGAGFLNFEEKLPLVLVLGGSLGASSLNDATWKMKTKYSLPFNLVHQCGKGKRREDFSHGKRYRQYDFLDREMGDVLALANLIVSRAGAGALYEFGFLKKPMILIPLPKSKSRGEQIENARHFSRKGAAVIINDEELNEDILYKTVIKLLEDEESLMKLGESAEALCTRDAEIKIANIIESMLREIG
jgi:UDP-N-acetylglucosamine--N-acetylmuramyl-(pentapeptide) pyrophosphoryl-undecaprenol N-acetylglucosamine transferase